MLILDGDTYEGISNVHITIKQTNKGAATYSNGFVNLEVVNFPVRLHLSHVSYLEKEVLIDQKTTDTLVVFLNPKTVMLDEIS
ncbi:MAG: carboxypeptidase-like regulatory domain-containing protein, partial [Bacteroidales bacterium]|nr:carboxypeptidase-like regulatory domain-containing protein [Bacteroidales bacterium]